MQWAVKAYGHAETYFNVSSKHLNCPSNNILNNLFQLIRDLALLA